MNVPFSQATAVPSPPAATAAKPSPTPDCSQPAYNQDFQGGYNDILQTNDSGKQSFVLQGSSIGQIGLHLAVIDALDGQNQPVSSGGTVPGLNLALQIIASNGSIIHQMQIDHITQQGLTTVTISGVNGLRCGHYAIKILNYTQGNNSRLQIFGTPKVDRNQNRQPDPYQDGAWVLGGNQTSSLWDSNMAICPSKCP